MRLHYLRGDGQPEAGVPLGGRPVDLVEALEYVRQVILRYQRACVVDRYPDSGVAFLGPQGDGALLRGVSDGVVQQVGEDLLQTAHISLQAGQGGHVYLDFQALLLRLPLEALDAGPQQVLQVQGLLLYDRLPRLDLG